MSTIEIPAFVWSLMKLASYPIYFHELVCFCIKRRVSTLDPSWNHCPKLVANLKEPFCWSWLKQMFYKQAKKTNQCCTLLWASEASGCSYSVMARWWVTNSDCNVFILFVNCLLGKLLWISPHLLDRRKKGNRNSVSAGDLSIIVFMCLASFIPMLYCDLPIVLYSIIVYI